MMPISALLAIQIVKKCHFMKFQLLSKYRNCISENQFFSSPEKLQNAGSAFCNETDDM